MGNSTGFDMELQDLAGLGHEKLLAARNQLLETAAKSPEVVGVRVQGLEDAAQLKSIWTKKRPMRSAFTHGHQHHPAGQLRFSLRE